MDNAVVPFPQRYLAESFPDIPLLLPVDADSGNESLASPNTTEVVWAVIAADIEKNLELILAERPATRTVYVVLGVSAQERNIVARIRAGPGRHAPGRRHGRAPGRRGVLSGQNGGPQPDRHGLTGRPVRGRAGSMPGRGAARLVRQSP
jgi:hypothetical protein